MKLVKIIIVLIMSLILFDGYCQSNNGEVGCQQGQQNEMTPKGDVVGSNPETESNTSVYNPSDPNEIIGTKGYDALGDTLQWVAATASLPYTIYFENDPELATAAAQKVEIRHALHPKADISTFAVGAFGFGSHVFTVEGNRSTYQQRLDLVEDMGIYVDVVAGIDIVANEVFWIFQSIDPATGLPPQGTQQGFLPVNDENHNGEGYVSFTIKPKADACVTGDVVNASASIVFDINEAIPTNVWHNTVDACPPTTQLTGQEVDNNEVLLQFSGTDDEGGCGIKQYKLYVSDNYGAYSLYDNYPVGSVVYFPAEYDHCYRFFCLGEDNVGNVEGMKEAEMEYGNYNPIVTSSATLSAGWNWFSTYLECNAALFKDLEDAIAVNNTTALIKDMIFSTMLQNGSWSVSDLTLTNESMYMVNVERATTLLLAAPRAVASAHPITLLPGWNWIGYISSDNMDIQDALSGLTPNDGDLIKNMSKVSTFSSNKWLGSLGTLEPGDGYMYFNKGTEAMTLLYPSFAKGDACVLSSETYWNTNVHDHATNLVLMATLNEGQFAMEEGNYEIGAFVGDECRGSARLQRTGSHYIAFLVIHGEAEETIGFRLYDVDNAVEVGAAEEQIRYAANAILGSVESPVILHFRSAGIEEEGARLNMYPNPVDDKLTLEGIAMNSIRVYDIMGQLVLDHEGVSANHVEINIKSLATGVYTVSVLLSNGTIVNKLIVKE